MSHFMYAIVYYFFRPLINIFVRAFHVRGEEKIVHNNWVHSILSVLMIIYRDIILLSVIFITWNFNNYEIFCENYCLKTCYILRMYIHERFTN